jgi:hypothetical protein
LRAVRTPYPVLYPYRQIERKLCIIKKEAGYQAWINFEGIAFMDLVERALGGSKLACTLEGQ